MIWSKAHRWSGNALQFHIKAPSISTCETIAPEIRTHSSTVIRALRKQIEKSVACAHCLANDSTDPPPRPFQLGTLRAPVNDPAMTAFAESVPRVNARAEVSPGFVWRFGDERPPAEAAGWPLFDDERLIASYSIWETPEALKAFVYQGSHGAFYNRRAEWFDQDAPRGYVLWWVAPGHRPDITEAWNKVDQLASEGPSDAVFTFALLEPAAGSGQS